MGHLTVSNLKTCITGEFESLTDFGPKGPLGNALLHKFALATEGLNPPHTYVPWIVIDGDSSEASDLHNVERSS